MATKTAAAKRQPKHDASGRFVGKNPKGPKGPKAPPSPSLAELVDGRLAALEGAIARNTEHSQESIRAYEQFVGKTQVRFAQGLDDVTNAMREMTAVVTKLPFEAADAAVTGIERRIDEGTKQLHRRVEFHVFDSVGVRMAYQSFDLAAGELLNIHVDGDHFSVNQTQPQIEAGKLLR